MGRGVDGGKGWIYAQECNIAVSRVNGLLEFGELPLEGCFFTEKALARAVVTSTLIADTSDV
ncbi:hypothetical protein ACRYCC_34435 [Actinomadura scrupuli]|uniref:hypothetical protein n=1 Tax=Actinomadura scrupuli TaxID=559629 RepID=UPI003D97E855